MAGGLGAQRIPWLHDKFKVDWGYTRPRLNKYISKEGNNIPITQRLGAGKFPDEKMPQLLLSGTIFLSSGLISVAGIKYPD